MDTQLRIIYRAEGRRNGSVCDLRDFCGSIYKGINVIGGKKVVIR